mgnify:CR=1 FL=1
MYSHNNIKVCSATGFAFSTQIMFAKMIQTVTVINQNRIDSEDFTTRVIDIKTFFGFRPCGVDERFRTLS